MKWYKWPEVQEIENFHLLARVGVYMFFNYEPENPKTPKYFGGFMLRIGCLSRNNEWIGWNNEIMDLEGLTHILFLSDIPGPESDEA